MEVTPLIINLHFPLAKCLLPVPVTLCFGGLEDLLLEGGMLPLGDTTMIPLIGQPPGQSGFLTPLNQQAMNGATVMAVVTDPDYQGGNWQRQGRVCLEYRKYLRVSLSVTIPCD